ncbi:uncharacterized protein LOC111012950 [Momordica charantia]|uniref:Uncharacterized protein LOC111012950 n=1 Tax=Momordica charantia TaxID=3673 RepID=A0A6J1CNR4_MOMCH|nr:uncharacterized protein LOC111012950 [Momordica charantia]
MSLLLVIFGFRRMQVRMVGLLRVTGRLLLTGWIKINVDVACKKHQFRTAIGIVCRNEKGQILAAASRRMEAYHDPLMAESLALLEGLRLADHLNIQQVQFESDSLQLINLLTEDPISWCGSNVWLEDIRVLARNFIDFNFLHVCRSSNKAARRVASFAVGFDNPCFWALIFLNG